MNPDLKNRVGITELKRHTLVEISKRGREYAFDRLKLNFDREEKVDINRVKQIVVTGYEGVQIPGIVRRKQTSQEMKSVETLLNMSGEATDEKEALVAVGFSSPFRENDLRMRIPTFVPEKEIIKTISPYELLNLNFTRRTKCLKALEELREEALRLNLSLGVWGSAGLEVYTILAYTDKDSDLDLIMKSTNLSKIKRFHDKVKTFESKYNCRVDLELEVKEFEIKVAELFSDNVFVLGKSINSVELYSKKEVLGLLE